MGDRFGAQRIPRSRWPLVGLLVVLAFLLHDLLMAGDAHHHATAQAVQHTPAHDVMPMEHAFPFAGLDGQCWVEANSTPDGCGYYRIAVPSHDDKGGITPPSHTAGDFLPNRSASAFTLSVNAEPTAPPGVRRAFLQVFLI